MRSALAHLCSCFTCGREPLADTGQVPADQSIVHALSPAGVHTPAAHNGSSTLSTAAAPNSMGTPASKADMAALKAHLTATGTDTPAVVSVRTPHPAALPGPPQDNPSLRGAVTPHYSGVTAVTDGSESDMGDADSDWWDARSRLSTCSRTSGVSARSTWYTPSPSMHRDDMEPPARANSDSELLGVPRVEEQAVTEPHLQQQSDVSAPRPPVDGNPVTLVSASAAASPGAGNGGVGGARRSLSLVRSAPSLHTQPTFSATMVPPHLPHSKSRLALQPWEPQEPLPFIDSDTRWVRIPTVTGFAAYWSKVAEASSPLPMPIDLLLGVNWVVRKAHESIQGIKISETPKSLAVNAKVSMMGASVIHKEVYPKDGSMGRGLMRRDVRPGTAGFRAYMTAAGELVLVANMYSLTGHLDTCGIEVLTLKEGGTLLHCTQAAFCYNKKQAAVQTFVGRRAHLPS